MSSIQPRIIKVSGKPVRVWRGGTGQALLLIHGDLGDAHPHWHWVWEQLGDTFTVAAPDLPGCGESAALPEPSLPAYAGWIGALLETLGFPRAALVGNGPGAYIARQYAAVQPYRVTHLVLVNGGRSPHAPAVARWLTSAPLLSRTALDWMRRRSYSASRLRRAVADERFLTPEFVAGVRHNAAAFVEATMRRPASTAPAASRPVSTLVLWGRDDRLSPATSAARLVRELPGASIRYILGAGHLPQMERPAEFVRAVREFCRGR